MSKLTENIEQKITKDIEQLGYSIEYTEYVKEGEQKIFRVVIDKLDSSLTTEDCEKVSRAIEEKVDEAMKNDDSYILEVSSPGLERALKNDKLYRKYIGYEIRVKLFKKIEDQKELVGILENVEQDYIVLKVDSKNIEIKKENIASGNTVYNF